MNPFRRYTLIINETRSPMMTLSELHRYFDRVIGFTPSIREPLFYARVNELEHQLRTARLETTLSLLIQGKDTRSITSVTEKIQEYVVSRNAKRLSARQLVTT